MALTRSDSIAPSALNNPLPVKSVPNATNPPPKAGKATVSVPRIDLEPLVTSLKGSIGEHWTTYRDAISHFVLGHLNQDELSRRIDHFICTDPIREHAHNQLVAAIYGNASRDTPEPGVASWVSANDKPTTMAKPASGDAAEQRLKAEVMRLPARERHRLKAIQDDPYDPFVNAINELHSAKTIRIPDHVPASAGGFTKTNVEGEVKKRFQQPLFVENNEFPDSEAIQARMTPICYEEGLAGGAANGCAEFLNVAAETFTKEFLQHVFSRVRSNGDHFVKTADYKRKLRRETKLHEQGKVTKTPAGLLPCEVEANANQRPLTVADLRVAIELGDCFLGQIPHAAAKMMQRGIGADEEDFRQREPTQPDRLSLRSQVNGVKGVNGVNGVRKSTAPTVNGVHPDAMDIDDADWSWQGGAVGARGSINSTLDDVLNFGL